MQITQKDAEAWNHANSVMLTFIMSTQTIVYAGSWVRYINKA